jgi:hypothetical protein
MRRHFAVSLTLALAACSQPPRSASYFAAHPNDAQVVLSECKAGHTRGEECVTALTGASAAADQARLKLYRRGF